jgi:hypothetical protein
MRDMATQQFTEVVDITLQMSTMNHNLHVVPYYRFSAPDGQFRVERWTDDEWMVLDPELIEGVGGFKRMHDAALLIARGELNTEPQEWPEFDEMAAHFIVEMEEAIRLAGGREKVEQMIADAEAAESAERSTAYCCESFKHHTEWTCPDHEDPFDCPDALIVRAGASGWGFPIRDGGSSVVALTHCPWCGSSVGETA